jgi:hypothetical protein
MTIFRRDNLLSEETQHFAYMNSKDFLRVEASWNANAVALRVVEGDEKGARCLRV